MKGGATALEGLRSGSNRQDSWVAVVMSACIPLDCAGKTTAPRSEVLSESIEMPASAGPMRSTPWKTALLAALVVVAAVIGGVSGLLVADREAFFVLKNAISEKLGVDSGNQSTNTNPSDAKPESSTLQGFPATNSPAGPDSKVIPTGLSSVGAIGYSRRSGSVHVVFNLQSVNLVGTGKLGNPDRIYFDLQETRQEKVQGERQKAQKAISIDAHPLTGVRIAQRESGAIRIVLDLSRSCDFKYQISPGSPSNLSVELRLHENGASAAAIRAPRN
jgi:hypothetical protein